MNNYTGSIDTDMGIGMILSNFETSWVMNSVSDSLNMRFRPFEQPMPNFPDILNRQFNMILSSSPDYRDQIINTAVESNKEIIQCICDYYNLSFMADPNSMQPLELYSITRTLYDIFVSRFTDYMINFYITYIMNNVDSIYAYLLTDDSIRKIKEKDIPVKSYIDSKFLLIHANLNKIILNMSNYDIPLSELLKYFLDAPAYAKINECIQDNGDIYKNHFAIYLQDNRYMSQLLTCIKLRLQYKTQEAFDITSMVTAKPDIPTVDPNNIPDEISANPNNVEVEL